VGRHRRAQGNEVGDQVDGRHHLGLAIDAGSVTLATKGVDIMPTFGTPPAENATGAQTITIAQLATHTAGFSKQDGNFNRCPAVHPRYDLVLLGRRIELAC
jgi:CubicO group peptidase (beta-lactamase class C family)